MKPYRSLLFMPGHRPELVRKGIAAGADALVLDLEDAVPQKEKAGARRTVAETIARVRADGHRIGLFVRPNALDTCTTGADLDAVVQPGLDGVFLTKVASVADVYRCEALLEHAEHDHGAAGLEMIVPTETAGAIRDVDAIAAASPRIGAVIGATARHADVARAVGFTWTSEGRESLYLRSRVLIACRAAGVHPLTGLWEDVGNLDGLRRFADDGRALGFRGMILIHPAHVGPVNEAFTPTAEEAAYYEGMVTAFAEAEEQGRGALVYEGEHIDIAHVATARQWLSMYAEMTQL